MPSLAPIAVANEAYHALRSDAENTVNPETLGRIITNAAPLYRRVAGQIFRALAEFTENDSTYSSLDYYCATYDALAETTAQDNVEEVSLRALHGLLARPTAAESVTATAPIDNPEAVHEAEDKIAPSEQTLSVPSLENETNTGSSIDSQEENVTQALINADYELCQKVISGDVRAQEQFIADYYRRLWKHANKAAHWLTNGSMDVEDLYQEAMIYTLEQAKTYRPDREMRFSRYVSAHILHHLGRVTYGQYSVRIPEDIQEILNSIERVNRDRASHMQRPMTDAEIANSFGIPLAEVAERGPITTGNIRQAMQVTRAGSIDDDLDPMYMGPPTDRHIPEDRTAFHSLFAGEPVAVDEAVMQEQLSAEIAKALQSLNDRQAAIVRLRFGIDDGEPKKLHEIAAMYGISKERVRQILLVAMDKLRSPQRSVRSRSYPYHGKEAA